MKKIFALGMVVFWTLMINHCSLEYVPVFNLLACSAAAEEAAHQPSDCGDSDPCAAVEDGFYKTEESRVAAKKAAFEAASFTVTLCDRLDCEPRGGAVSPEAAPPELSSGWQFSFRAALAPRAPSVLS